MVTEYVTEVAGLRRCLSFPSEAFGRCLAVESAARETVVVAVLPFMEFGVEQPGVNDGAKLPQVLATARSLQGCHELHLDLNSLAR